MLVCKSFIIREYPDVKHLTVYFIVFLLFTFLPDLFQFEEKGEAGWKNKLENLIAFHNNILQQKSRIVTSVSSFSSFYNFHIYIFYNYIL